MTHRTQRFRASLAPIGALAMVIATGCAGGGLSISLTQDQLQRIVDAVFPLEGDRDVVGVVLSGPNVSLVEGSDRIAFGLAISVSVVLEPGEGRIAEGVEARTEERAAQTEAAAEEGGRGARARNRARGKVQGKVDAARGQAQERVEERAANRDPEVLSGTVTVSTAVRFEASTGELFLTDFRLEEMVIDQLPGRFNEPVTNLASNLVSRSLNQVPIFQIDDSSLGGSIARALLNDVVVEDGVLKITVGLG